MHPGLAAAKGRREERLIPRITDLEVEKEAARLAEAGAWQPLCDFIMAHLTPRARPRTFLYLATGAIEAKSASALDAVVRRAVGDVLPSHVALAIAHRLAMAGEAVAAWTVLLSRPDLFVSEAQQKGAIGILNTIVRTAKERALRTAASALLLRFVGQAKPLHPARKWTYDAGATPRAVASSGSPIRFFNRDGVPAHILAELQDVHDAFEKSLGNDVKPEVRELRDVFVNRRGQIWLSDGSLVVHAGSPLAETSLAAAKSAPVVSIGVLATEGAGFYHWLVEWLPSLFWAFSPDRAAPAILLRDDAASYQTESLKLLVPTAEITPVGDALRVERLYIGDRRMLNFRYWDIYQTGFDRINQTARAAVPLHAPADSIYISRKDADRRRMLNEDALIVALEAEGYQTVNLSALSLAEQIVLFASARNIIAPHGAGLAHLLAKPGKANVYELLPMSSGSMSIRYNFARMSRMRGDNHALRLEPMHPITNEWSVDVPAIMQETAGYFDR
jgi:capsular polysaccharide biosynthesis protein